MFIAESVSDFLKIGEYIWQSYKQERDCLVHFLCLLTLCLSNTSRNVHYQQCCTVAKPINLLSSLDLSSWIYIQIATTIERIFT